MTSVSLNEACQLITDGTHYTPANIGNGVPFLTVKDVSPAGLDFDGCARISRAEYDAADAGNSAPKPGDVLFSKDGTVGKVHVVQTAEPFAVLSSLAILRPSRHVDSRFLGHMLGTAEVLSQAVERKSGSAIRRIILSDLRKVELPLPPLDEQRRIAAILDQADALRAKRRQVLAHLDALTQSIFHDLFDGVSTSSTVNDLAANSKGSIRTGPFGSQLLHGEFVDEGIAVLGLDNVVGNEFRWAGRRFITLAKYEQLARYTVYPGDVLVSIMGTTGRCVVVPDDIPIAINTKHICAITPDRERLDPIFLRAAFLWHPESRAHLGRQTKGSIMDGLNMGIIKAMPVPVPALKLQQEFADRVGSVNAQRTAVLAAQAANDELFDFLQSRAFRGEL